jgi:lysophospholipase L1-like esterase
MGILDAPGYSRGQADSKFDRIDPRLAAFQRKIKMGVQDGVILCNGDSTTSGDTRPIRLLCDKFAAQYPTHTILYYVWVDASKTWAAPVTVQTGTGSRTIHVYNQSISGQVIGYAFNFLAQILAGNLTPDVIIWNYGHNSPQDYGNYRALVAQAITDYRASLPAAAHVIIAQNPQAVANGAAYTGDQEKQRANYDYAAAEGHTVVDVNADFIDYGNYAADLLQVDGLHPNDAGNQRFRDLIWEALRPRKVRASGGAAPVGVDRVWIPAKDFDGADGTPNYAAMFLGLGAWNLDQSTEESIVCVADWPNWSLVDIDIWTYTATTPATGARDSRITFQFAYLGSGRGGWGGGALASAWTDLATVTTSHSTTSRAPTVIKAASRTGLGSRPIAIKVVRKAADAADTLPQDLQLAGVMIHKMA